MNIETLDMHKIIFGRQEIEFFLEYKERKTLQISVLPDQSIKVVAPTEKNIDDIMKHVYKKASWILNKQEYFRLNVPIIQDKKYISGESHYYLGKQFRLKIVESQEEFVSQKKGYFYVYVKDRSNLSKIKNLLDKWYREKSHTIFSKRLDGCYEKIRKHGVVMPVIKTKKMKTKWGSCSLKGSMTLNLELIKAPIHCIDYVIMHELCHMKYFSHCKKFYKLLSDLMNDWQIRKQKLNLFGF